MLLQCTFAAVAMQMNVVDNRLNDLLRQMRTHELQGQSLCKKASTIAEGIDHMNAAVLYEVLSEKNKLLKSIEQTLSSISEMNLDAGMVEGFKMNCFNLTHRLNNDINLVKIETKYTSLTTKTYKRLDTPPFPDMADVTPELRRRQEEGSPARLLPLPEKFASLAIYHIETKKLDKFTCGLNTLYNACNIEDWCGIANAYANFEIFRDACIGFLKTKGKVPKDSLNHKLRAEIYAKHFENQHIYRLQNQNGQMESSFPFKTAISGQTELLGNIKIRLETETTSYALIHFTPSFVTKRGRKHAILITLVQNKTGRGLYIFDNCNDIIDDTSPLIPFLEFLSTTFNVSRRNQFVGPRLPHGWPTVRQQDDPCADEFYWHPLNNV